MGEVEDEDLAVADLAGVGRLLDGFDDLFGHVVAHRDLDLGFRQEVHLIFGTPVDFGVPFLAAEAFDFGHRHPLHAQLGQRFADGIKHERLEYGYNELHLGYPSLCAPTRHRRGALRVTEFPKEVSRIMSQGQGLVRERHVRSPDVIGCDQ